MEKVELSVIGISYSQSANASYQLMLYDNYSKLTLPIVIGAFEAQAIAIQLEDIVVPRPLTHDLIMSILDRVTTEKVESIDIYKLEEGIFYSKLVLTSGVEIDCRTSDAIAIALRADCPIYVNENILQTAGIQSELGDEIQSKNKNIKSKSVDIDDLQKSLDEAIKNEDYEKASKLKEQIEKIKNQ